MSLPPVCSTRLALGEPQRTKLAAETVCAVHRSASKLYVDALVRDQAEAFAIVGIYALISRMGMMSNADVVENAEAVIRTTLSTYSRPIKTFPELQTSC